MEEDKSLWDGDTIDPPLRRPTFVNNSNTNSTLQETRTEDVANSFNCPNNKEDVPLKSTLSAHAREWFPPNYNKNNVYNNANIESKSANDRLLKYKLQNNAQTVDIPNVQPQPLSNILHDDDNMEQRKSLQQLEEIMSNLIVDPGHFDNLLGLFIEILKPYYDDVSFISYIAESIVGKALNEPNFRYSAARLCNIIQVDCPLFRTALCVLCQKKVKEQSDFNLSLLLAELYVQLGCDNIYSSLVIECLQAVLQCGDANSIKSVCQVLKLTGATLEVKHKDAINGIFIKLIASKESQLLSIKNLIDSVLNLRSSNWGQTENNINITNNRYQNQESQVFHDGPIFYGPDGHELSEEECQFLNENCSENLNDSYDDYSSELDPEMDEEMQIAYDQFLRLGK
ncbi:hypothetical protein FQR65_LT07360 [Abscondita terminalis]|nr:hypothetical protein FQR65_LT07360 [Abscondita terminalis]